MRPEGGALVVLAPYARHMLEPVHVDADRDVGGLGRHPAVVAHLDPDGVQAHDRTELVQRPLPPFEHGVAHRVGDVGYRLRAQLRAGRLLKVVLDVAHRHAARVQGYDHLIQSAQPPGMPGHQPRGGDEPSLSRGTSTVTSPTGVDGVLGYEPLREFACPPPAFDSLSPGA